MSLKKNGLRVWSWAVSPQEHPLNGFSMGFPLDSNNIVEYFSPYNICISAKEVHDGELPLFPPTYLRE